MAGGKIKRALQAIEDATGLDLPDLGVKAAKAARDEVKRTPSTLAAEPPKAAPRRRVKPKVRLIRPDPEDADPDKWLQRAREEAAERYGSYNRLAGKTTASVKGRVELDPQKLVDVPGAMGERRVPGDEKYDRLMASVQEKGFDPNTHIWLGVNHLGEPYVAEGNTRLAVARDLGIQRIPAEVMWYGGGEGVEGPMMPELLEKYMPPSELSLDPNFRRWFGSSKTRDDFGEPRMFYHATPNDFSVFKPGGVDPEISGSAMWFSPYAEYQPAYHRIGARGGGFREGTNVMPVYLRMENPLLLDDQNMESWARDVFAGGNREFPHIMPQRWVDEIRSEGYDSVMFTPPERRNSSGEPVKEHEYIVFEPTQIKSATGNRGTYDPNDPDIRKARGGLAVKRKRKK